MPAPEKPATTPSLPGKLAKRTDGGVASKQAVRYASGMPYGEGQDFLDIQSSAPMEKSTSPKAMSPGAVAQAAQAAQASKGAGVVPLDAPSQMPGQPVTHGADAGAGPGTEALGLKPPVDPRQEETNSLIARYLPDLQAATNIPGVPDSYRRFVGYLARQVQ
jgi:hypothetical protein